MNFKRLDTKMFLLIFGFVSLVQIVVLVTVQMANHRIANDTIERELDSGSRLFDEILRQREVRLLHAARLLSADLAFRAAAGTGDVPTVAAALRDHGRRMDAAMAVFVDLDGRVVADSLGDGVEVREVTVDADVLNRATIGRIDGRAYQLLRVPVMSPLRIGTLVVGFEIDESLARQLGQLTGLEIAFLDARTGARIASTTQDADLVHLAAGVDGILDGARRAGDGQFEAVVTSLTRDRESDRSVVAALMVRRSDVLGPFRILSLILAGMISVSLGIVALGTVLLARGITRPLAGMAQLATRYAEGDFRDVPTVSRRDEVGMLARAFGRMRDGLFERERRIQHLAYNDSLTGLPNRLSFDTALHEAIAARSHDTLAVVVINLDRFKDINSALGHSAGDRILTDVARRLAGLTPPPEKIARLGADEFALLLPIAGPDTIKILVDRLNHALRAPVVIEEQRIDIAVTAGAAIFPDHGESAAALMSAADVALHVAKTTSADYSIYDPALDESRRSHLSMLGELREAIERGELELWYQPKLNVREGTIGEVEALVRWRHPDRGLVPPFEFIGFAERTGFVKEITRHVLELAIAQSADWRRRGLDLKIAVNVSAKDLFDDELPDRLAAQLARHRVTASALRLEITETAAMNSPEQALGILERLRALGVSLAVDDFGVGQSSLGYLQRLPVEELKIDRSFVSKMCDDRDAAAIVRSAIDLGHNMGLRVVAEGVETETCYEALAELGCDALQGYWLTRPLAADLLETWLDDCPWTITARRAAS